MTSARACHKDPSLPHLEHQAILRAHMLDKYLPTQMNEKLNARTWHL